TTSTLKAHSTTTVTATSTTLFFYFTTTAATLPFPCPGAGFPGGDPRVFPCTGNEDCCTGYCDTATDHCRWANIGDPCSSNKDCGYGSTCDATGRCTCPPQRPNACGGACQADCAPPLHFVCAGGPGGGCSS